MHCWQHIHRPALGPCGGSHGRYQQGGSFTAPTQGFVHCSGTPQSQRRKKEMERKTYDGTFLTSMTYFEFLTSHVFGQFWRDISPILFLHHVTLLSVFGPVVNLCCKVLPQSKRIQTDGQKYCKHDGQKYCKHLNIYCEASGHESHARKGNWHWRSLLIRSNLGGSITVGKAWTWQSQGLGARRIVPKLVNNMLLPFTMAPFLGTRSDFLGFFVT